MRGERKREREAQFDARAVCFISWGKKLWRALRPGQTLLATQRWTRADADAEWRLVSHETIPFAPNVVASAVLRCDQRGCVALLRTQGRELEPAQLTGSAISAKK